MNFLRPPSAQSTSVTLDQMRAHSGSPFQGSHGRPSPTPSCYSVYVPDNEQDEDDHMPSHFKQPTRNQVRHQQQQQHQEADNSVEREEESSHYDAARLEEIQRATAEHNAAYGIADELNTTLWDLKSGTDGPAGKPPYPYLTRMYALAWPHQRLANLDRSHSHRPHQLGEQEDDSARSE